MKSERLSRIAANCEPARVVADIGCDHGFLCAELIQSGRAEKAIAADISAGSLAKAESLAEQLGLAGQMECRLGDGLSVLEPGEAEGIVIAGVGGPLIMSILEQGWKVARGARYLVLCPHNYPDSLRQYLNDSGFLIEREEISREKGKFYPILKVRVGQEPAYSPMELLVGRNAQRDAHWQSYVQHEATVQKQIAKMAAGTLAAEKAKERLALYQKALEEN